MSNNDNREVLEIFLNGNIDKANARETEESILDLLRENEHSTISVDLSGLKYISEEGLDTMKNIAQKTKNVELVNVTDDIYEVFKKKGITDLMPIKRMKIETA